MNNPIASRQYHLNLSSRPRIRNAGLGVHGRLATETFRRRNLWGLHLYFWSGAVEFDGQLHEVRPHCLGITPPDTELTWHFPLQKCPHLFIHFELNGERDGVLIPTMQALGERFESYNIAMEWLSQNWQERTLRCEVKLWEILWELAEFSPFDGSQLADQIAPEVVTAKGIVDTELHQHLNGKVLANRVGISYAQLNRLFRRDLNVTVGKYIRDQRSAEARRLLVATKTPVAIVAHMTGFADLHYFNKFIRKRFGVGPRELRANGSKKES